MSRQRNNDTHRRRQRHLVAAGILATSGVLAVVGAATYSYAGSGWSVETTVTIDGVTSQPSPGHSEALVPITSPEEPGAAIAPAGNPATGSPALAQSSGAPAPTASEPRIEATATANPGTDPTNTPSMPPNGDTPSTSTTPAE